MARFSFDAPLLIVALQSQRRWAGDGFSRPGTPRYRTGFLLTRPPLVILLVTPDLDAIFP